MPIRRSGVGFGRAYTAPTPAVLNGLTFPSNLETGADIRLVWNGANLLSRTNHTVIWKANYIQQAGYYAVTWHSYNVGEWQGSYYEYGCHPFPGDGSVDGNGESIGSTSSAGTVHYYEIAGLQAHDYLASVGNANGAPLIVTKGVWVTQARTCSVQGSNLRHRYYPDVSSPTRYIEQTIDISLLESPSAPAFYFGTSDWRAGVGGSGTTDEAVSGTIRGFALFNAELSITDIATEAASESNSPQTSSGATSVWYINKNPTPTDVTDKSGAGHHPSWANSNRPTLWTG